MFKRGLDKISEMCYTYKVYKIIINYMPDFQLKDVELINKTPHKVVLFLDNKQKVVLEAADKPVRVRVSSQNVGTLTTRDNKKVPLVLMVFSDKIENLPAPEDGKVFIVSRAVCEALPDRDDLAFVADTVRNKQGRIIGARSLILNKFYSKRND